MLWCIQSRRTMVFENLIDVEIERTIVVFGLPIVFFLAAKFADERYLGAEIIGLIFVGILAGPGVFDLLHPDEIELLATLGLVYLMFLAGLEINLDKFYTYLRESVSFGLLSFLFPQILGTIFGYYVLDLSFLAASLLAAIFSSHTLLAYDVVKEQDIVSDEAITVALSGIIVTDSLALIILGVAVASVEGSPSVAFWAQFAATLVLFFVVLWAVIPRLGRWFLRNVYVDEDDYGQFLFLLAIMLVCAALAEVAGIKDIIGAFIAGLLLGQFVSKHGVLMNRTEFVGNALFIPFFLLYVGMLVDVRMLLESTTVLGIGVAIFVLMLVGKFLASVAAGWYFGYSVHQTGAMFGLTIGQAAASLAIVIIGADAGLFDEQIVTAVVLMILGAAVVSPLAVKVAGRALEDQESQEDDTTHRVMISVSPESKYLEELLDFGMVVREDDPDVSLYTLSVVKPDDRPPADEVGDLGDIEELLSHGQYYSSGAGVPVESQRRYQREVAPTIARAVLENRITKLVIGWDGGLSRRRRTFGTIIDETLTLTNELVFVCRVRQGLEPTERVVLLLPPGIVAHDGFEEGLENVAQIANDLEANLTGIVIEDSTARFERAFRAAEPDVEWTINRPADLDIEFDASDGGGQQDDWEGTREYLRDQLAPTDLVVLLSVREGSDQWNSNLQRFPKTIARITASTESGEHSSRIAAADSGYLSKLQAPNSRFVRRYLRQPPKEDDGLTEHDAANFVIVCLREDSESSRQFLSHR